MSKSQKKKKVVVTTEKKSTVQPTQSKRAARKTAAASSSQSQPVQMMFGRENYLWILGGIGLIILGLALMSGGKMTDPNVWDPSIIYSFRRMVIAPVFILAGLGATAYAIFK